MVYVLSGQIKSGRTIRWVRVVLLWMFYVCICSLSCWSPVSSQRGFILQRIKNVIPFLVVWNSSWSDNGIRQYWDTLRQHRELLSKLIYLISRNEPVGPPLRVAVPSLLAHSRFPPPPVAALPAPQCLTLITWQTGMETGSGHSLLAQTWLQHAFLKPNGNIRSPLWGCVPPTAARRAEVWWLFCSKGRQRYWRH